MSLSALTTLSPADKYVTLGVGNETFAVTVDAVREILDFRPMAALPNAPAYLMGVIDVRGHAVPVISLARKLGLIPAEPTEHTRIVVTEITLEDRQLVLGLVADRVFEVTALDDGGIESAPDIGVRWRSDYIQAIGRRNGGFVVVFELTRLFTSEETALLTPDGVP